MIYLDHAATTPVAPEVFDAMRPYLTEVYGNPSAMHGAGRAARAAIDAARDAVAATIGAQHREIVFTGSGTEADNLAIRGVVERWGERGRHVVTSAVEHEAVLTTCEQLASRARIDLTVVSPDSDGRVDPGQVAAAVRDDTVLVSIMAANNEVGTVQDIAGITAAVKSVNPEAFVHTDAVQALGKLRLDVSALGVDLMSLSAHKVYGPKGTGALYVRHGVFVGAQLTGGGQERGRRSGTENVTGIVGLGVAAVRAEDRRAAEMERQESLAARLREAIVDGLSDVRPTGSAAHRLPNIVSVAIAGVESEVLVTALDQKGIAVSGGSACSSGATLPSHVLAAMDIDAQYVRGPLRCSLGEATTAQDIEQAASAIIECVERCRASTLLSPR